MFHLMKILSQKTNHKAEENPDTIFKTVLNIFTLAFVDLEPE